MDAVVPAERFRFATGAFLTVRAALWLNFLKAVGPSWLGWAASCSLLRGSADVVSLAIGGVIAGSIHYGLHYFAGLIIVPGQARRTSAVLRWLSQFTVLDRVSVALRPGLENTARALLAGEVGRAEAGRTMMDKHDGVRVRLHVPLAVSGGEIDGVVVGASRVPRPSSLFLNRLSVAGLVHAASGTDDGESSTADGSDDDSSSLLRRGAVGPGSTAFSAQGKRPPLARLCIVYLGGNAEVWEHLREAPMFLGLGCSIVAVNYPGVGDSPGHCTVSGLILSGAAALEFAQVHLGFDRRRIVIFGHSIGGGVACELSRHFPECHLLADRTFGRIADVAAGVVTRMVSPATAARIAEAEGAAIAALGRSAGSAGGGSGMELGGPNESTAAAPALPALPPPPSAQPWSEALMGVEGWCRLLMLFVVGWEIDAASGYRAALTREAGAREALLRAERLTSAERTAASSVGRTSNSTSASSSSRPDAIARAIVEARSLPGLGLRLMLFSPADRVIPVRTSLPFTVACEGGPEIPPGEGMALPPVGSDQHNREFTAREWAVVGRFLDACARHA